VRIHGLKSNLSSSANQRFVVALGLACVYLLSVSPARAQTPSARQELKPTWRLLTAEEGRSIIDVAWAQEQPAPGTQDCSHLIHDIYQDAGFQYRYDSSFELYEGNEHFVRVRFPHPGDLIVWPGHVGIVVDPLQHSFYSLVSTGLEEQDYEGPYWKSRGRSRFYRYKVQNGGVLTTTKVPDSPQLASVKRQEGTGPTPKDRSSSVSQGKSALSQAPKTASAGADLIYGAPASLESTPTATAFQIPSSVVVTGGGKPPTPEEVAESISELSDAAGHVLRTDDPSKVQSPVVIVERFTVERVDIKQDRGWARLQVDSNAYIISGTAELKPRREKVRWELRRSESGWEAVVPADRTYVPRDVAVKNLAAQLARLTESQGSAEHQEMVARQESEIANLLGALLKLNGLARKH
jgi:NlpC/P60 family